MFKCLECGKEFKSKQGLSSHVGQIHMPIEEYNIKFGLIKRCIRCSKKLSKNNNGGFCNHCRDRSGKNNPAYGKSYPVSNETKQKHSENSKKLWQQDWYREKIIKGVSKPRREGFAEEQSKRITQWYIDNPEQKTIRSECMKKSWEEGKIVKNNFNYNKSKLELQLKSELEDFLETKIINKTLLIEGGGYLFPDMIIEGTNIVIEFYGDYWHMNPNFYNKNDTIRGMKASDIWERDNKRIEKFSNILTEEENIMFYNVIEIWQDEYLNNKEHLFEKLNQIINWESCSF